MLRVRQKKKTILAHSEKSKNKLKTFKIQDKIKNMITIARLRKLLNPTINLIYISIRKYIN